MAGRKKQLVEAVHGADENSLKLPAVEESFLQNGPKGVVWLRKCLAGRFGELYRVKWVTGILSAAIHYSQFGGSAIRRPSASLLALSRAWGSGVAGFGARLTKPTTCIPIAKARQMTIHPPRLLAAGTAGIKPPASQRPVPHRPQPPAQASTGTAPARCARWPTPSSARRRPRTGSAPDRRANALAR